MLEKMYSKYRCKDCHNDYMREYRNNNRARYREIARECMTRQRDFSDIPQLVSIGGKLRGYFNGERLF